MITQRVPFVITAGGGSPTIGSTAASPCRILPQSPLHENVSFLTSCVCLLRPMRSLAEAGRDGLRGQSAWRQDEIVKADLGAGAPASHSGTASEARRPTRSQNRGE
jgi:hypothetical protein